LRKIEIEIGGQWVENPVSYLPGVISTATLLDDLAPQICEGLWNALPIETRTIHAFHSGQTWRTEKNFQIAPDGVVENFQETLEPGDIVFLNFPEGPLFKIFFVYGIARVPTEANGLMSVIGKIDENFDGLDKMSRRILYEGPKNVTIRRKE
tara:strand:- start:490 stop:945 length:456 start_codon:yes stop_codon:yes gene_type:complete